MSTEASQQQRVLLPLLQSLRADQWIKNLFVFAPAFFGGVLTVPASFLDVTLTFVAFCSAASAAYLFNDLHDRQRDQQHPRKALRPIASGRVAAADARVVVVLLTAAALGGALVVSRGTAAPVAAYLVLNLAYSLWLKHIVILDVFCIAAGFVLRTLAGAAAANVMPSEWIIMTTFLLALFLALTKRRQEIAVTIPHRLQRPVLQDYSVTLLDQLIAIATAATMLTYILYTLDPPTVARFGTSHLFLTALPVIFGVFRYLFLVHLRGGGEAPGGTLLNDGPLLGAVAVWVGSFAALIYFRT